ncbi:hypothetical protein H0H93_014599 [Arthromyces matolae]|nr:hypothetical protein H0H93_014599 [Arthromyces matolae]
MVQSLLDDVRAHRIPVDFLDLFEAAKVPFYDGVCFTQLRVLTLYGLLFLSIGCMIVELLDYRPQRSKESNPDKPERTRVVLHPNSETLWADICAMNQRFGGKWSDREALEAEARLVHATSPPLCLDPDPHLARIANHIMRVSTPSVPVSLKRKVTTLDPEEDETDKARRAKIMSFMNSRQNRAAPSYRMLETVQRWREKKANPDRMPTPASVPTAPSPTKSATPSIAVSQAQSPAPPEMAKVPTSAPATLPVYPRASATPAPQPTTHQFINANPNGRTTPAQLGIPAPTSATPSVARNGPLAPPKQSPMPTPTQLPPTQQQIAQATLNLQQQQLQQQQQNSQQPPSQPGQHPQHTFTPSYNPAHLRPGMVHGATQIPPHLAAAAAQARAQAAAAQAHQAQPQGQAQAQAQRPASAAGAQPQHSGMYIPPQLYGYPAISYAQGQQMQQMTPQLQAQYLRYQAQLLQQQQQQQQRMNAQAIPPQVAAKAAATGGLQNR